MVEYSVSMSVVGAANQVAFDPSTGEVVGGLAGLRELIRIKKEQEESGGNLPQNLPTVSEQKKKQVVESQTAPNRQPSDTTKSKRKRSRRKKKSETNAQTNATGFKLPIRVEQVVYAEVAKVFGISDVKIYVVDDGRLFIYTRAVFAEHSAEYCKQATKMLTDAKRFMMAKVGDVQLFIARQTKLTVAEDSLIYAGKYRIDSCNERVFAMAKQMLSDNVSDADEPSVEQVVNAKTRVYQLGSKQGKEFEMTLEREKKPVKQAEKSKSKSEKQESKIEIDSKKLIETIAKVQQIATKVAKSEQVDLEPMMEVFLLINEASVDVLVKLVGIEPEVAESVVDGLRRMYALGVRRDDGTYPILIKSVRELGDDVSYTLQSTMDNYRSVVKVEDVRGKKLVYDLDEMALVIAADEYITCLANYCRLSRDVRLRQLFDEADDKVLASEVLQTVSADEDRNALNTAEYDLFHSCVTKYMLAAGWVMGNPTDGYPWVQLNVEKTFGLDLDTMRYIQANLDWIKSIYTTNNLRSLRAQVVRLSMPNKLGAQALQADLASRLSQIIGDADDWQGEVKVLADDDKLAELEDIESLVIDDAQLTINDADTEVKPGKTEEKENNVKAKSSRKDKSKSNRK